MKHFYFYIVVLVFFVVFHAHGASAATFSFDAPARVSVGETFEVAVLLDTEGASLNAIEGVVAIPDATVLEVVSVSTTDSVVPLWIETPTFQEENMVFSGIMPGGFSGISKPFDTDQAPGKLFTVELRALSAGELPLSLVSLRAYHNSEFAEPAEVTARNVVISAVQGNSQARTLFIFLLGVLCIIGGIFILVLRKRKKYA